MTRPHPFENAGIAYTPLRPLYAGLLDSQRDVDMSD